MPKIRRIKLPDGVTYDVGIESGAYKPAGSVAFANLPVLSSDILGYVYNITDDFTTTSDFIEGAGKTYPAGTNVGVIETEESGSAVYKFDVFSGFIDMSGKADTNTVIASISRSGTTFTAKNSEGDTLFTFEQQDTDTTYSNKAAASGGTDVSLVTTGEKYNWNSKTSNTGTVTSVATGAGLTGGTITGSGTIKAKLKSETQSSLTAADKGSTSNREYAVGLDASGNLSVNVPWDNTTYTNASLGQGYGTCATAAATTAKVVTLSNYALVVGGYVSVLFTYAVPAGATLNINSKGAKAIYYKNAAITANIIKAGNTATFMYDGTYYRLVAVDTASASYVSGTTLYV